MVVKNRIMIGVSGHTELRNQGVTSCMSAALGLPSAASRDSVDVATSRLDVS
jgi:hypothetical protein